MSKEYYVFIDESGDHCLEVIDLQFPVFTLAACIFECTYYEDYANKLVDDFKHNFFETKDIILHSSDIRKRKNDFSVLNNRDFENKFHHGLNEIMQELDYCIIAPSIDKNELKNRYEKPSSPYDLTLKFVMERLVYYLKPNDKCYLIVESRDKVPDSNLLDTFHNIMKNGTYYIPGSDFRKHIISLNFRLKKQNINGLQIADLVAYPFARNCIGRADSYKPFEIVRNKVYTGAKGEKYGIKIFP